MATQPSSFRAALKARMAGAPTSEAAAYLPPTLAPTISTVVTTTQRVEPRPETSPAPSSDLSVEASHLVAGIEREFGLGDQPRMRRALYARAAAWYLVHPDKVREIVSCARMQARQARLPGVYFAATLARKLGEAFGQEGGGSGRGTR